MSWYGGQEPGYPQHAGQGAGEAESTGPGASWQTAQPAHVTGQGAQPFPLSPQVPTARTPTPPFPAPQTPSRPSPSNSPLQRLTESRWRGTRATEPASTRTSASAQTSAHPDGIPAPLPFSAGGVLRLAGGARQRFSGSGIAPRARVWRQEGRARRVTLALAAVAVLLVASSAMVLFDPAVQRPGFGFALGQLLHKQPSGSPLYVDGTEPPTPTPSTSNSSPSATPSPGQPTPTLPGGTSTPQPTATATPQPTPVPTVIPGGAVVSFMPTTKQIARSSFTGCSATSSCDFLTGSTNTSSPGAAGPTTSTGWQSIAVGGTIHATLRGVARCDWDTGACSGVTQNWHGAGNVSFPVGAAGTCTVSVPTIPGDGQAADTPMCPWWRTTSTSFVNNHTWQGTVDFVEWLSDQTGCNPHCGWFIQWNFSYYNNNWPSQASYWYVTSQDCTSVVGSADSSALRAASSAQTSWIGSRVALARPSPQVVNNGSVRYCSPAAGTQSNTGALQVRGFSAAAWSATVFDPAAATAAAAKYINANVPQAYTLTAGPTTCSTQSLTSSSNYSYNSSSGVVTVNCPSTGTATYDWTSATQGQNAQSNLKAALASRPLSTALDMCNGKIAPYTGGYPGIQPGTCTITLTGGNVSMLPDATKIQISSQ